MFDAFVCRNLAVVLKSQNQSSHHELNPKKKNPQPQMPPKHVDAAVAPLPRCNLDDLTPEAHRALALQQMNGHELVCSLAMTALRDPVRLSDGFTYDREYAKMWLDHCERTKFFLSPHDPTKKIDNVIIEAPDLVKRLAEFRSTSDPKASRRQGAAAAAAAGAAATIPTSDDDDDDTSYFMLNSRLFKHLDLLRGLPLTRKLNLVIPSVVIVGDETVGKSTLLERLIGFPVLPRNAKISGRCTMCVVHVHLRRGEVKLPRVSIVQRSDGAEEAGSVEFGALDSLCNVVKRKMDELTARFNVKLVTTHEVVVSISVPYAPDLDVIDVPGLVMATPDAPELVAQTRELATSVLTSNAGSATVLLVGDIRVAVTNSAKRSTRSPASCARTSSSPPTARRAAAATARSSARANTASTTAF
jgi:hypothetical protein